MGTLTANEWKTDNKEESTISILSVSRQAEGMNTLQKSGFILTL